MRNETRGSACVNVRALYALASVRDLPCPKCGAEVGEDCYQKSGGWTHWHKPRLVEYNRCVDERIRLGRYAEFKDEPSPSSLLAKPAAAGGVYLIEGGGLLKIGRSVTPRARLASMRTGSPAALTMLTVVAGGPKEERRMHERFAVHRKHGEWFTDCPEIREAFGVS